MLTTNRIGLFGITFFDLGNDHLRARLVLRPFDDDDVIAHVDGKAVMRAAGDPEESIGDLLRSCSHRGRCGRVADLIRHVMSTNRLV